MSHLHTGALLAENAGLILDSWHSPPSLDERAQRLGHVNDAELSGQGSSNRGLAGALGTQQPCLSHVDPLRHPCA